MRIKRKDGTMVEESDTYILADGETMVVPTMMMDSARRMITDAHGNPAGQRPGFLYSDSGADVAEAVRTTVYAQYDADISQRWRSDRWQSQPSKPEPSAPTRFSDGDAAVAAAHAQYRADLEARWRK